MLFSTANTASLLAVTAEWAGAAIAAPTHSKIIHLATAFLPLLGGGRMAQADVPSNIAAMATVTSSMSAMPSTRDTTPRAS